MSIIDYFSFEVNCHQYVISLAFYTMVGQQNGSSHLLSSIVWHCYRFWMWFVHFCTWMMVRNRQIQWLVCHRRTLRLLRFQTDDIFTYLYKLEQNQIECMEIIHWYESTRCKSMSLTKIKKLNILHRWRGFKMSKICTQMEEHSFNHSFFSVISQS